MARQTFYELVGVTPTTPPAEIAAAIKARLAATQDSEAREELMRVRETLLHPHSRESYDRVHRLRGPLTAEEWDAYTQGYRQKVLAEVKQEQGDSILPELLFVLYVAGVVLMTAFWSLTILSLLPELAPTLHRLLALRALERWTLPATLLAISVPYLGLALLALHLFDRHMRVVGRMAVVLLLNLLLIWLLLGRQRPEDPLAPLALLPFAIQFTLVGIILVRYLGKRDLEATFAPKVKKRKRP